MAMKISQREARRLQKRVDELEEAEMLRRANWRSEWPGGTNVDTVRVNESEYHIAHTCRRLGHAVVIVPRVNGQNHEFLVYALPLPPST